MFRRFACVCVLIFAAGTATAADKKPDPLVELLAKLKEPVRIQTELDALPFRDIVQQLEKDHGLKIVVLEDKFRAAGEAAILDKKPALKQRVAGLRLGKALDMTLASMEGAFLVRKDYIEIMPQNSAALETTAVNTPGPLVSAVFKEKPLNEAVSELAEDHDATIVVAPQTGDARMAFVNARLLNVPLQTALELLAVQTDLRVVKRKNAFLITTTDAANGLRDEEMQKERVRAEVRLLRAGKLPGPPTPPEPPKPDK
jgi:hypothetical protein